MTSGRLTDYKEKEVIKKSRDYIDSCYEYREVYEVIGYEKKKRGSKKTLQDREKREYSRELTLVRIPTIEGLALALGIARSTLYLWKDEHKVFSDIIEELQQKQAQALIHHGVEGRFNPTITKVLLTKHGYREGVEHTGHDGGAIEITDERRKQVSDAVDSVLD